MSFGKLRAALRPLFHEADAKIGGGVAAALLLACTIGGALAGDPNRSYFVLERAGDGGPPLPSAAHWLGTDSLFRDELARLLVGGRTSLAIGVGAALIASLLGSVIGVLSAALRDNGSRFVDAALLRVLDVLLSFPFLLAAALVGVLVGGNASAPFTALVLGLLGFAGVARFIRARALELFSCDFVAASRALGGSLPWISVRHIAPNIAGATIVVAATLVPTMILSEAALSYLGLGVAPPAPAWGRMIHEAESVLSLRPLLIAAPGAAIVLSALAFARLGQALARHFGLERVRLSSVRATPFDMVFACAIPIVTVLVPASEVPRPLPAPLSETPRRGGTLRLATAFGVTTLDPAVVPDELSQTASRLVFGRLFSWNRDGTMRPDIGRSLRWTSSTRLEIEIRSDARFHDGASLTATDVKRSIERALSPESACPQAELFDHVVGFAAFHDGRSPSLEGLVVEAPTTLSITLTAPQPIFEKLMTLSYVVPVCPSVKSAADGKTRGIACGAGPFKLSRFDPDEAIELVRFVDYHEKDRIFIEQIELSLGVRSTSQRYRLETGALDLVREFTTSDMLRYQGSPAWASTRGFAESTTMNGVFMNVEMKPFDDVEMRRAVRYALDPEALTKLRPGERTMTRIVPPAIPGATSTPERSAHDLDAALSAMARAGFPFDPVTGEGGYPLEVAYLTVPDSFEQYAAEVYKQQLARIGLRIRIELLPFQAYLARVMTRNTATMGWIGWGADYPDPLSFFQPTLHSRAISEAGSQNYAFFADAPLDALIDRAASSTTGRVETFEAIEARIADRIPWVPTHASSAFEVWQPRLRGYSPHPLVPLEVERAWLAD